MRNESTYADFGVVRSLRQVKSAIGRDHKAELAELKGGVERDLRRLSEVLGRPLVDQRVLEIGPGQGLERAHYIGLENSVEALDLDVIGSGRGLTGWIEMAKANGLGRLVKSAGRELLVNRSARRGWVDLVGGETFIRPIQHHGDIVTWTDESGGYDAVVSWSVFEHVADPRAALLNVMKSLRPGGAALISIHNYTSTNGHHDIRSFTGSDDVDLLWGHLRASTVDGIHPSAYLNEWRIEAWRELLDELAPGYDEYLDQYEHPEVFGPLLDGPVGAELPDFSREELLTVNAVYVFGRPDELPGD